MPNLAKDRLFSYPLPEPQNTAYHKLGVVPEATAEEIRVAKGKARERLQKKKMKIDEDLAEIYRQVPGLQQISKDVEALRMQGKSANTKDLNEKEKLLAIDEELALSINHKYKQLLESSKDLLRQINEINLLNLEKSDDRLKYDQETPPCALMKLEKYDQEIFTDGGRRLAFFQLRLELGDFLEEKGETCYHPSDLTRKDFLSDFTSNPLLDK